MKNLPKSIRLNHQYPQAPAKPEVDLDFRHHPNMVALSNCKIGFLDLENIKNVEIAVIDATKATVFAINAKSEVEPEVDLEFRGHANMQLCENVRNRFIDLKNINY